MEGGRIGTIKIVNSSGKQIKDIPGGMYDVRCTI